MAVVCPACEARFRDPPEEIARCRPLQCGHCEHIWTADVPRIRMDAPSIAPELADLSGKEMIRTNLPVVVEQADVDVPVEEAPLELVYVDRLPQTTSSKPVRILPPILALTFAAVLAGGVVFKSAIMAEAPQTVAYYQALGLVSKNPGLSIANVVTTKSSKDGISQLIVKGEVQNIADNTVPVPPLKLIMRGKSNANLYAWTVTAGKDSLDAGESSRFTAVAHDIPGEAVNVEVEFTSQKSK